MRIYPQPRRGLVAAIVLVILVVVATVGTTIVRMSLAQRSVVEAEERRAQVDWLVESGRRLGAENLKADAAYRGETWKIPSVQLGGRGDAEVLLRVFNESDNKVRTLEVIARYPINTTTPVQRTARFPIQTAP